MADEVVLQAQVRKSPVRKRKLTDGELESVRIKALENQLLENSLGIINGICEFADIEPGQEGGTPTEWIEQMGQHGADKRWRLANAGWLNSKDAPNGISVATKVAIGIIRARAASKVAPQTLNITQIEMTVAPQQYPSIDVED